jgi:hypothetical protein
MPPYGGRTRTVSQHRNGLALGAAAASMTTKRTQRTVAHLKGYHRPRRPFLAKPVTHVRRPPYELAPLSSRVKKKPAQKDLQPQTQLPSARSGGRSAMGGGR